MKKILLLVIAFTFYLISQAQINSSSFDAKVDFSIGSNGAINVATEDMDGDGKKDVVVANQSNGVISIFRNTSTSGSVSFDTRIDSTIGGELEFVLLEDMDGDGMLDIVVSLGNSASSSSIVIFRNVSTTGNILVDAKQTFTISGSSGAFGISIADLDGDGKSDIVVPNFYSSSYSIYRNTSTSGSISFATVVTTSISSPSFNNPSQVLLSDLDGDGKKDISIICAGGSVWIFRNTTTTAGSITVSSTIVTISAGNNPRRGDIGDLDGDGMPDISVANYSGSNTSLFRNTSTLGSISFATKVDFSAPSNIQSSLLRDLDEDGKPEIIQSSGTGVNSKISIYRNFANSGTISTSSFGTRLDISSANQPVGLDVVDIDGDGKLDILSANFSASSFSVFRSLIVPSGGLIAYYPFNGNAGDSSGFENHGTVSGGASLTTGREGVSNTAYYFDGIDDKITVPKSISIQPANQLTLTAWIQPDSKSNAGWSTVLTKRYSAGDPYNSYSLTTYSNSNSSDCKWAFYLSKGTTGSQKGAEAKTATSYNSDWIFLSATYDSSYAKLYINGVLDTTIAFTGNIGYSIQDLVIGYTTSGVNDYYKGKIDEISIYNRALTASEISFLYDPNPLTLTQYYSNATGYLDSLSTWGTNPDGSGTHPLSFDSSNTVYNVVNNASPAQSSDWIVTGVNTAIVFGDGINSINMSVPSGLFCGSDSIYIRNGVTYTVEGTLFYNKLNLEDGSTVQYLSSGTETLIPVSYSNLVVYGGTKSISGNTTVRGTLAMIADIDCGGDTLTLGSSASQTGTLSYTSGVVSGAFSRWFSASTNSGSTGLFPMGSSSQYNPIQVEYTTAPTSGGVLTTIFTSPTSGNIRFSSIVDFSISPAVSLKKVSPDGFWTISPSKGLAGGTYKAIATATGFSGISSISGLRLMRRDNSSSAWTLPSSSSAIAVTGSTSSPVVGRSGLSTASSSRDFGIGADSSVNPLPVNLIKFDGKQLDHNSVLLTWTTAQEINNDYFEIEKLGNTQWNTIGSVKGNLNSTQLNNYQLIDETAFQNTTTEYYQLKQVDKDGKYNYSQKVSVSNKIKQNDALIISPNPSNGSITVRGLKETAIVRDALGNEVYRITTEGIQDITFLKQGVYFIQSGSQLQKLIKY